MESKPKQTQRGAVRRSDLIGKVGGRKKKAVVKTPTLVQYGKQGSRREAFS